MLSDLGRLDIGHLGLWLNFDGIRGHDEARLRKLATAAAELRIGAEHQAYADELADERARTEAMALFTSVAHETRHFHDLLMTPYGSALMGHHMRAAFALQSALGSLAAASVIVVPLRDWDDLLPVLRRIVPELEPPPGRLRLLAETRDAEALKRELRDLVRQHRPELLAETGCGPLCAATLIGQTAGAERFASDAQFARVAGVAPIPVSSGRHDRHRLDRGGNRQLNRALHVIAIIRGRLDPQTRAYLARKEAEGKSRIEAMRCLKRHYHRLLYCGLRRRVADRP